MTMPKASSQRILENLNTAVVLADAELRVAAVNPAAEMLFEVSSRQALGRSLTELLPRNQALIEAAHQALVSGHPFTEHGLRLTVPGNRRITVDCTVTPLARGHAHGELLIELIPIDRLLRLAREENLQDQYAANRAVLRGLAHEIKNPLGGLRGAAQLLEDELEDRGRREYTRIIIHEADRLRNLVDRMMGPATPPRLQPVNIHQLFEHVRSLLLAEYPVGVVIQRDYDPSLPELPGDPEQLIQALLNIARNAAQAINGQGVIRFRTRAERNLVIGQRRHRLVLWAEIEDNGPGVAEELRERIFFPLVTGRAEGTGLGLAIARSIVHQHHGAIECISRPQQTIFRISLPLEPVHD
jgi:two-component system nitrogen regulation sensor histidine kinase GlnL